MDQERGIRIEISSSDLRERTMTLEGELRKRGFSQFSGHVYKHHDPFADSYIFFCYPTIQDLRLKEREKKDES